MLHCFRLKHLALINSSLNGRSSTRLASRYKALHSGRRGRRCGFVCGFVCGRPAATNLATQLQPNKIFRIKLAFKIWHFDWSNARCVQRIGLEVTNSHQLMAAVWLDRPTAIGLMRTASGPSAISGKQSIGLVTIS